MEFLAWFLSAQWHKQPVIISACGCASDDETAGRVRSGAGTGSHGHPQLEGQPSHQAQTQACPENHRAAREVIIEAALH